MNCKLDKKTKIVATISDLNCGTDFLESLYLAGADIFRMNTAHQTPEDTLVAVNNARTVSSKIPIMIDTKGPEVRTTGTDGEVITVASGQRLLFKGGKDSKCSSDCIFLNYDNFHLDVAVGSTILYDDGEIAFTVLEKSDDGLVCEVLNDGVIKKDKKSINVPGVHLQLPSLTERDIMYVEFSAQNNIDFIAHSFIRNKQDLLDVQQILDKYDAKTKIIAKIENQEGVDNLDEILDHCAGIMVARGDLGIEIPAAKVPVAQKLMIRKAIEKRKIVITATQMLHTMIDNPRPTRAEVNDIANAVYDGSDCLMLSGETAYGKYPLAAVQTMANIICEIESLKTPLHDVAVRTLPGEGPAFLTKAALEATEMLPVKAVLTDTLTGRTARYLAAFRGNTNIYALTYDETTMRTLAASYGVYADTVSERRNGDSPFAAKLAELLKCGTLTEDDMIVVLSGNFGPEHGATALHISTVKNLMK